MYPLCFQFIGTGVVFREKSAAKHELRAAERKTVIAADITRGYIGAIRVAVLFLCHFFFQTDKRVIFVHCAVHIEINHVIPRQTSHEVGQGNALFHGNGKTVFFGAFLEIL